MRIALFTYWFTWRQRPHHFVEVANRLGHRVDLFSNFSISNYVRGVKRHSLPDSSLIRYRSIRPVFPSPLFDRTPIFTQFNSWQRRCVQDRFSMVDADAHVFAAVPFEPLTHKPSFLIYDCMDDWSDFPSLPRSVVENERILCQIADRIWVVSEHIYKKFESEFCGKLQYVPNGVDHDHFAVVPRLRVQRSRPVLGYMGTLHTWFDAQLVATVADSLPDWDIIVVGRVVLSTEQRQTLSRPNIHFTGRQSYASLPEILASFDVAMIPFVLNDLIKGTSPIKLYEYLAAGLPVVSTSMPEVLTLSEPGRVMCADEPGAFAQAIVDLYQTNTPAMVERRQQVARQHTWQARFEQALEDFAGDDR